MNEYQAGDVYGEMTHDPEFTKKMFRLAHTKDPDAKLLMNEYGIINHESGKHAQVITLV